jgi:pyrroloquinoline-quinone synthase
MNFIENLVSQLSEKHLLKHEVYQAWSAGTFPRESLQTYAKQYYHHVKAFPRYLSATHSNCDAIEGRQILLDNLIDEEKGPENHPELWLRFAEGLGVNRRDVECTELLQETSDLIQTFMGSARRSYAEGMGALFAYEHQIPAIATFKIEALKKHYAIQDASTLSFFEVHRQADIYHTEAVGTLLENLSPEDQKLAAQSAKTASNHLWKFLDGIRQTLPC